MVPWYSWPRRYLKVVEPTQNSNLWRLIVWLVYCLTLVHTQYVLFCGHDLEKSRLYWFMSKYPSNQSHKMRSDFILLRFISGLIASRISSVFIMKPSLQFYKNIRFIFIKTCFNYVDIQNCLNNKRYKETILLWYYSAQSQDNNSGSSER